MRSKPGFCCSIAVFPCRAKPGGLCRQSLRAGVGVAMTKYLTHPVTLVLVGLILGAAYGSKIPVVNTVAAKLPGSQA